MSVDRDGTNPLEMGDRRVRNTRTALKHCLIGLLQAKPIDRITVKEICEAANLNRSTFYAHFASPADLLRKVEQELLQDTTAYLGSFRFSQDSAGTEQAVRQIVEYIVRNADLCKVLLGPHGDTGIQREIMLLIERQMVETWKREHPADEETLGYALLYMVGGSIGMVQHWLGEGMRTPPQEFASMLLNFTYGGLSAL